MLTPSRPVGFTLIELLVAMSVLALLLAIGIPSLSTYLQGERVKAGAQVIYSGLQLARTEAIRRNVPVQLVLTDSAVAGSAAASSVANAVIPSSAGQSWLVRAAPPPGEAGYELIDAKSAQEGSGGGSRAVKVSASASAAAFTGLVTFNSLGGADDAYAFDIEPPIAGSCVLAGGPIHCKRVTVSPGGQIRVCDPAVTDDRRCPS